MYTETFRLKLLKSCLESHTTHAYARDDQKIQILIGWNRIFMNKQKMTNSKFMIITINHNMYHEHLHVEIDRQLINKLFNPTEWK